MVTETPWKNNEDSPRAKLLQKGEKALSDAELIAIIIRTGSTEHSVLELANLLIKQFGGVCGVLDASAEELCQVKGIGIGKCVRIKAVLEISRRYLEERVRAGKVLGSSRITRDYLMARLKGYPHEVFGCLFLDNRHKIIRFEELFTGSISAAMVHPREIVRKVLSYNAAAVIFCHNHPSGNPEPSDADRQLTERLKDTLHLVDVRVLDHIVVGAGSTVSFAERGMI